MRVYLDYSATTPVDERVLNEMLPYFSLTFGNANSQHSYGRDSAFAVDESRRKIAACIGAEPSEIYFTSGGTEADNWAIKGVARRLQKRGNHIIVSAVEHDAVLSSCRQLENCGFTVSLAPVNSDGIVEPQTIADLITDKTILISIMYANNEIGTIMPIKEIADFAHKHGILFHTDAVQAIGSIPVNVKNDGVDLMSFSAHKFYGPKGIGALYIKSGTEIDKFIAGGHQEKSQRGGTINVPAVVGMSKALELAIAEMSFNNSHIASLRDYFAESVEKSITDAVYNGHRTTRLPQNANFTFPGITGEQLLLALDLSGVSCSSGAACSSGSLEPSHVMKALGYSDEEAKSSLRFSFGKDTTKADVDYALEKLFSCVADLRKTSSLVVNLPADKHHV